MLLLLLPLLDVLLLRLQRDRRLGERVLAPGRERAGRRSGLLGDAFEDDGLPHTVVLARSEHEVTLGSLAPETPPINGLDRRPRLQRLERLPSLEDAYLMLGRNHDRLDLKDPR